MVMVMPSLLKFLYRNNDWAKDLVTLMQWNLLPTHQNYPPKQLPFNKKSPVRTGLLTTEKIGLTYLTLRNIYGIKAMFQSPYNNCRYRISRLANVAHRYLIQNQTIQI